MKYAIFGDIHGKELSDLEKALNFENPSVLICTGDFDQTKTIHQFRKLEEKYHKEGKVVITVPGNHDHAILNNFAIKSMSLTRQGKKSSNLHQELIEDPVALQYLSELVNSKDPQKTTNKVRIFLDESRFGKKYQTIIMHGAYAGDLSFFSNCPQDMRNLWTRLKTENDHLKNFDVMNQKGYKVMIRGHDHEASYVYEDPQKRIVIFTPNGTEFRLLSNRRHTINPGALSDGHFATIDTRVNGEEVPMLKYHRL
jgi:predicted phosphodiesterase